MGIYYTISFCGGISMFLAFFAFLQGNEMQAIFLLIFTVLCSVLAVFFKLIELNENIKKILESNSSDELN